MDPVLLTFLNSYVSTLRLARSALLQIPHVQSPTIQTQDSWLSHFHLLWTLCLEFTLTRDQARFNSSIFENETENFPFFTVLPFQLTSVATSLITKSLSHTLSVLMLMCVYWFALFICLLVKFLSLSLCLSVCQMSVYCVFHLSTLSHTLNALSLKPLQHSGTHFQKAADFLS